MKKTMILLAAALLFCANAAFAQHEVLDYSGLITAQSLDDYTETDLVCQRDGKNIFGKIYKPKAAEGKKVPMVIHAHGYNSSHGEPEPYAKGLAKSGYGCVIFDFCGGGNLSKSDGKTTEMSVFTEQEDVEAVMKTVCALDWVDANQIYVMGYSQGGLVASIVGAANPDKIAGLILIYPALLIGDHAHKIHPKEAHTAEAYDVMGLTISHVYYDRLLSYDVYEDVKKYKGPVVIIYGDKDSVTGFNAMERAAESFTSPEFHIIKDGTHGFPPAEHKIMTTNYALEFLQKHVPTRAAAMQRARAPFGFGRMNINRDSLNRLTAADYSDMIRQLGVKNVRPGRDPNNPDSDRQPNYNEMIANPFPFYPDALTTFDGKKVKNAKMWTKVRRPELVKTFEEEIYGRIPSEVPAVTWEVTKEEKSKVGDIPVVIRQLLGKVDNSACPSIKVEIQAQIVWPENSAAKGGKGLPVIMEFTYMLGDPSRAFGQGKPWQQQVLERGWAAAQIVPTSYQADGGHGLTAGIIGLTNKGEHRKPNDWGALRAWGWGASKMIDYLETDPLFDAKKVAIEGVSRYGKASLVAMAFDERIAAGFVCSSGKGGATGWRRDCGESVGNLAGDGEYHWMAGNFIKYGADDKTADDMPIDQHELISLCAPRPCFISTGTWDADKWQDIMGMFMMTVKATPVYELLGKKGLNTEMLPLVDQGLLDGTLVYRQHHGGHEAGPNWPFFLDFFEREMVEK